MLKTLAYRAFSARKLANMTMAKKDEKLAVKLENEFLTARLNAGAVEDEFPVPETQVGNAQYAEWVASMEGRF